MNQCVVHGYIGRAQAHLNFASEREMADPTIQTQVGNYGMLIGFVYVFNLIIGSGALTMPRAFQQCGLVLASVFIVLLGFMSFVAATFMVEAMALANVAWRLRRPEREGTDERSRLLSGEASSKYSSLEGTPVRNASDSERTGEMTSERTAADKFFAIRDKFEMGEMAKLFFSKGGQVFFYVSMILYLYGDLVIYDAAMAKTLRDFACNYVPSNKNQTLSENDRCWTNVPGLSRLNAYRAFVGVLNTVVGPFVFCNMQKTKFIQMISTAIRWLAFITMISLAGVKIADNASQGVEMRPELANVQSLPNFVGICIYAFMCHHSLPSIISPIRRKESFKTILLLVYLCTMAFYFLNSYLAVFAFGVRLQDLYTLNFLPEKGVEQSAAMKTLEYFLTLFPVFTASTSFPILAITLRNNIASLLRFTATDQEARQSWPARLGLPLLAIVPPMLASFATHDLGFLVGITGSYAGMAIQYVIPSCLVYLGRKHLAALNSADVNRHLAVTSFRSPFRHGAWVAFVWIWCGISLAFVTIDHIYANL